MADVLVAAFSRTGVTEKAARALAKRLDADLELVRARRPYDGAAGLFRAVLHSLGRRQPDIVCEKDPAAYGLVVVGAPVWAARLAAPMRTYLARHGKDARALAAFSVSGSGGAYEGVFQEVEALGGRFPTPTLTLSERAVLDGDFEASLDGFVRAARSAMPAP